MEFLSVAVFLLYIGMISIAKGFGDAAYNHKKYNPVGAYNDTWHKVTRWLYYYPSHIMPWLTAILVWLFPPTMIWTFLPLGLTPVISFLGMRRGVDFAGKDEIWYGEEFNWTSGFKALIQKAKSVYKGGPPSL